MPVETAKSILIQIKNAMEVVKSWRQNKDRKLTLNLLNMKRRSEPFNDSELKKEAMQLSSGTQVESLQSAYKKIDECFSWYSSILSSDTMQSKEVDEAGKELINCIGGELTKLNGIEQQFLTGTIKNYWMEYGEESM
jgi:hypothetical protein